MVLDELARAKTTLSSCSLVCRAWLYPSRVRLFSRICIPYKDRENGEHDLATFPGFLDDSPHFCNFVRTLLILDIGDENGEDPALAGLDQLVAVLDRLERLHTLEFRGLDFDTVLSRSFIGQFALEKLTIDALDNEFGIEVLNLLCLFSSVRTLEITEVRYGPFLHSYGNGYDIEYDLSEFNLPMDLAIQNLKMEGGSDGASQVFFFETFHRTASIQTLTSIVVDCEESEEIYSLLRLIKAAAPTLKAISMDVIRDIHSGRFFFLCTF